VAEAIPGYAALAEAARQDLAAYIEERPVDPLTIVSAGENLACLSRRMRRRRIDSVMARVEPIVIEAAMQGYRYVSIASGAKELYPFADDISNKLFNLGVHSVQASPREFTVFIRAPPPQDWVNSFVNPDYEEGGFDDDDDANVEDDEAAPPSV
jgi:hypothetical protein